MAPRFKSLFGWSSSIPDKLPRGRSFEPPISSSDYATPLQPREPPVERPKTAPQKTPASNPGIDGSQRTRSGFSTKSPPTFAATASRKNSVASTRGRRSSSIWTVRTPAEAPPPLPTAVPSLDHLPPLPLSPAVVGGFSTSSFSPPVSPPLSLDSSLASPKPYIDILDAHSSIKAARVRSKPLIVRDYGEDVADRNIASFGAKTDQKPISSLTQRKHLDILVLGNDGIKKSGDPQYDAPPSPRTTSIRSFTAPRPGIAYPPRSDSLRSDHTLSSSVSGDERVVPSSSGQDRRGHAKSPLASPITSRFEDAQIQPPRPPMASPVRPAPAPPSTERARQRSTSVATVRSTSHPQPVPPLPASDVPSRQTSTSSSQPDMATRSGSPKAPSGLDAGRGVILPSAAAGDDVPPTKNGTTITDGATSSSSISLSTATGTATPRTASPHSVSTHAPSPSTASSKAASRKRASSRQGSVSYSAFPSCNPRESRASDMSTTSRARSNSTRRDYRGSDMSTTSRARSSSRRRDYVGSTGTAGPTPVIVVGDSADTQVTTKTLPAVEHEEVFPTQQTVKHEATTIETHTHEVYHRVLPVIGTKILPTKHYVPSEDGKSLKEIQESQIPYHALIGKEARDWHGAPGPAPCQPTKDVKPAGSSPIDPAKPPVIGLARGEPKPRPRGNSVKSTKSTKSSRSIAKSILAPVLASKKEYITEAGHPRTEYVWHHPPVMETSDGQPRPIYIGAGIGDLNSHLYSSDEEEDVAGARFGAEVSEGGLLFKESDYERSGSLPGLDRDPNCPPPYRLGDTGSVTTGMSKMRM